MDRIRQLLRELPEYGKLAYCLLRDDRVPAGRKAALAGGLALIFGPWDPPSWIPLMGQVDELALSVLAVRLFIESCPDDVVREHERLIEDGMSVFDHDFGVVRRQALELTDIARERWEKLRERQVAFR
jgi:uncharacterized membrane protein YkvA (DUF1232 family)